MPWRDLLKWKVLWKIVSTAIRGSRLPLRWNGKERPRLRDLVRGETNEPHALDAFRRRTDGGR